MSFYLFFKQNWKLIFFVPLLLFAIYSSFLYLTVGQRGYDTVLVVLAKQFLTRHLILPVINLPVRDIANYYENYYVYFGPLSSLLLMPFVFFFGDGVPQVSIGVGTIIVSFFVVYLIAKKFKFNNIDCLWLSLFFSFSTVLYSASIINITASEVEALGVPFILLAIYSYLYKKNPFLIGFFIALAVMTRFTLMLAVIFFFAEVILKRLSVKQFIAILIPVILALAILGLYNNRRFHSFFETGYHYSITANAPPISENLKYGETNIIHIPANLYSFLFMAPEPLLKDKTGGMVLRFPYIKISPWGLAIWFTSPLFLLLIFRFKKGKYMFSAAIASFFLSLPVFLWYSIGYAQVGYRYALDFLPFLFLILLVSLSPKLSKMAIILIVIGVIFNCIYTTSIWEIYPVFNIYPHP